MLSIGNLLRCSIFVLLFRVYLLLQGSVLPIAANLLEVPDATSGA